MNFILSLQMRKINLKKLSISSKFTEQITERASCVLNPVPSAFQNYFSMILSSTLSEVQEVPNYQLD